MIFTSLSEQVKADAYRYLNSCREGIFSPSAQYVVLPGLCDCHVHFREPGFSYKETIKTGSMAAARGGFTDVMTMPNLDPTPDSVQRLTVQTEIISKEAVIGVHPFGAVSRDLKGWELSDMEELSPYVCGFSDDGKGVQSAELTELAMQKCAGLHKVFAAHCEMEALLGGGVIHEGYYAQKNGLPGIPSVAEYAMVKRDIGIAKKTGCAYHVCHVSCKESVELVRKAKAEGVNITCETAPHYLCFTDEDIEDDGRFKMNPPIRGKKDREALIAGLLDGTVDMIATDHAPHSMPEKSGGLLKSLNGVVGLETAFAAVYTQLVRTNIISLKRLSELMSLNPRKRFGLGTTRDFAVFDVSTPFVVEPESFASLGRATPFAGKTLYGKCMLTVKNGEVVYIRQPSDNV